MEEAAANPTTENGCLETTVAPEKRDPTMRRRVEDVHRNKRKLPWRLLLIPVACAAVVLVVLRFRSASHDLVRAFAHLRWEQLPWLCVAICAEALSFTCYALVQRRLLLSGGAMLKRRSMFALAVAATGLTNLVPGGTAPASGWLVAQYRRRGVPMPLALWAILVGGYAATVSILSLLLLGAGIAGLVGALVILACAIVLAGAAFGIEVASHHVADLSRWLEKRKHHSILRLAHRITRQTSRVTGFRTSRPAAVEVLVLSVANWSLDVFVLIAAFGLLGLSIPWRAVLFAYATAQVAGSLAPVPGGIGFVEGGMIGAFALAGSGVGNAVAATVVYRAITCWAMAVVGSTMLLIIGHREPVPAEQDY
jgi:putative heme transporter